MQSSKMSKQNSDKENYVMTNIMMMEEGLLA